MKKQSFLIVILLGFSFSLISLPSLVSAQELIYIKSDGTVEGTDKIQQDEDMYTFTGDIQGQIIVQLDNVVVDGSGYNLAYPRGTHGITVNGDRVTLKGIIVTQTNASSKLGCGIYFNQTNSCRINNCTITVNNIGITVFQSLKTKISNCKIANNAASGISVNYKDTTIIGNHITGNVRGIYFVDCVGNTVTENQIENNFVGIDCLGLSNVDATLKNVIYENNFVNNTYHFSSAVLFSFHLGNVFEKNLVGNYWDDYNGTDTNNDGIGDTPYALSGPNQDRFPLINPIEIATIPEFSSWIVLVFVVFVGSVFGVLVSRNLRNRSEK